jgi:hypothetical protein
MDGLRLSTEVHIILAKVELKGYIHLVAYPSWDRGTRTRSIRRPPHKETLRNEKFVSPRTLQVYRAHPCRRDR